MGTYVVNNFRWGTLSSTHLPINKYPPLPLSPPPTHTQNLDFEGIMRFYFQNNSSAKGSDTEKVATKCIRVSNSATTEVVIRALVQKFRPDMRMLSSHSYALYEVHANQGEGGSY